MYLDCRVKSPKSDMNPTSNPKQSLGGERRILKQTEYDDGERSVDEVASEDIQDVSSPLS